MIRPDRRALLLGGGLAMLSPAALPRLAAHAFAAEDGDALVIALSDIHSAYPDMPYALATLDWVLARHKGMPALIVINGDLFERGNVVALRSGGELDFAFLRAVVARAPTIVNLGNHETALLDDLAEAVKAIEATGASVVTSLRDRRNSQNFALPSVEKAVGARRFTVAGIATDALETYRAPARPHLDCPEPIAYVTSALPNLLADADIPIVLSHAGVVPDRTLLSGLPAGTLLIGGHDHLRFIHRAGSMTYLHPGSYLRGIAAVVVSTRAGQRNFDAVQLDLERWTFDRDMTEHIRKVAGLHLTGTEKASAVSLARAMPLGDAARVLVRGMARIVGADFGLINHTTLGAGLAVGAVTSYDLANFVRFDGPLFRGETDGAGMTTILNAANQDEDVPLDRRSGDFLYASIEPVRMDRRYAIVTNGWVKQHAQRFLGREDIVFTEVANRSVRSAFEAALRA